MSSSFKERYGFASVFGDGGRLLGYLKCVYPSRIEYVKMWLSYKSTEFYDWRYFVLWIDGKKHGVYYRS